MPRVMHFEVPADDPDRAIKFYARVFGWKFEKWEGSAEYWSITTGPENEHGINGGLTKRSGFIRGDSVLAYICSIKVPSVDEFVEKIKSAGGFIAGPKMAIPGIGWLAYCKDTEGNMFSIMQEDKSARNA